MTQRMILSVLFLVFTAASAWSAEIVDAVAATVDREVILYSDIIGQVRPELESIRQTATSQEEYDREATKVVDATLQEAIESKILYREAIKYSIEASDESVEERIASLRELYDSNEEFIDELNAAGETLSDFRQRTKKQLMAQRMAYFRLSALEDEVVVSEDEIAAFYEENRAHYERAERVRVRQIFLRAGSDPAERDKARARLELIREEILAGAEFEGLAVAHSEAPGAEDGGIIGWQQRGDLIAVLETAAFGISDGEISDVIDSRGGVHLLKVDEHQEAGVPPIEEVRGEIEPIIRAQAAEARYRVWMDDLVKRSRVRIFI